MFGIIFLVILVVIAVVLIGMYNSLVQLRIRCDSAWSDIDVQLKRRHDLIPNLVETAKGYMAHERGTLDEVVAARNGASAAEAAIALLASEPPWSPRDRRLSSVLASAPPRERAELLSVMCVRGATFASVAPHLEPLLTSSDPGVTERMQGVVAWLKSPKLEPLLRQALPRVVDAELRAEIAERLGEVPASYWAER